MKLINVDDGTGRMISTDDVAKLEQAIYDGQVSIDLGEAQDFQGDFCLSDDDYQAALKVLAG